MLDKLLNVLFGCPHHKLSFPQTQRRPQRTYRVCLDCGREFDYDWQTMKVMKPATHCAGRESEVVA